jgi:hypothetical protein
MSKEVFAKEPSPPLEVLADGGSVRLPSSQHTPLSVISRNNDQQVSLEPETGVAANGQIRLYSLSANNTLQEWISDQLEVSCFFDLLALSCVLGTEWWVTNPLVRSR